MDFQEFKKAVIAASEEHGVADYELYYASEESTSVGIFKHEVNQFESGLSGGVSYRAIANGRMGYASTEKLDSITTMYTEQLNYANFRDTLFVNVHLARNKGVKTVPDMVKVGFFTDVLTDEEIEGVPIQGINMPPGKVLRTFPSRVPVHFVAGASVYKNLSYEDFTVVADYKEMKANPSEKCRIYLKKAPPGISRARLSIDAVDYLIEEEQDNLIEEKQNDL